LSEIREPAARKAVIIPCSGIGKAFGSVSREASFIVVEELRPVIADTVCLGLLTMGDEEARALVRELSTITIDGCPKTCARLNVQASGARPAADFRVVDVYRANRELKVDSVLQLGDNGRRLARILAEKVAAEVDRVLAGSGESRHA
jgi:uncharacterized metal-binding protein